LQGALTTPGAVRGSPRGPHPLMSTR
jgi:hypothetical protein